MAPNTTEPSKEPASAPRVVFLFHYPLKRGTHTTVPSKEPEYALRVLFLFHYLLTHGTSYHSIQLGVRFSTHSFIFILLPIDIWHPIPHYPARKLNPHPEFYSNFNTLLHMAPNNTIPSKEPEYAPRILFVFYYPLTYGTPYHITPQ